MRYELRYTDKAIKSMRKLDRSVLVMLKAWIEKNLVDTANPRAHGKALTADRSGQWRYRVGDYRILADIQDDALVILLIDVGHRSRIYL